MSKNWRQKEFNAFPKLPIVTVSEFEAKLAFYSNNAIKGHKPCPNAKLVKCQPNCSYYAVGQTTQNFTRDARNWYKGVEYTAKY